ncbi:MAG TPA: glycosyltransferase family 1 protein [Sedimenticola sp.]|nr:glycosyltransferase family 1 protein [Sedimenticola sp.]
MKIGFVTRELPPSRRVGGIGNYVWDTARYLAELGHQIIIIAASDNVASHSDTMVEGVRVIRLEGADFFMDDGNRLIVALRSHIRRIICYGQYRRKVANRLDRLISKGEVEIVEFAEYGNEAAIWARQVRKIPMVIRLHGSTLLDRATGQEITWTKSLVNRYFGLKEMKTLQKADAISSPSKAMVEQSACAKGVSAEHIEVIPNTVCIDKWRYNKECQSVSIDRSTVCIFSAGSVTSGKGFSELVEAVRQLRKEGLKIKLMIAGKLGALGRRLVILSKDHNEYREWLDLPGEIPRVHLGSYYANADLVIFPSWWEPFGLVCIEAMAAQALVIGSNAGGMAEIIDDGVDGFLVVPKNVEKLKQKINYVLSLSEEKRRNIRVAAERKVCEKFDIKTVVQKQLEFYNRTLERFKSAKS